MVPVSDSAVTENPSEKPQFTAAVIDDIFDKIQPGEIPIDLVKAFLQFIEEKYNSSLKLQLEGLPLSCPDLDEVTEEDEVYIDYINQLWDQTNDDGALSEHLLTKLFVTRADKKHQLNAVCANIVACNISVSRYGSINFEESLTEFQDKSYNLVFIDFYLSVHGDLMGEERAIEIAKKIDSQLVNNIKPVTVLMSSHANVEQRKREFREKADLTEAAFQFEPKSNLTNSITAKLKISAVIALLEYINQVQQYVQALSNAAINAADNFNKEIKALTIQDYAFIQQSRLNEEEHPLGDYMNWLYGSRWGSLLFSHEQLRSSQINLDSMRMETGWLLPEMPSMHVSNLYASALYEEHIGELAPNPLITHIAGETPKYFLHLGDIFSNIQKDQVWLVINPQCDLERTVAADQSILLLPGKLASLEMGHQPSSTITTELFLLNSKPYKIIWDSKRLFSKPYGSFTEWIQTEELDRKHRLKLPFALNIQQQIASTLTRVGLNAPPPLMQVVKVELWARDYTSNKSPKLISSSENGVFRVSLREKNKDVSKVGLTLRFAYELLDALKDYYSVLKELKTNGQATTDPSKDIGLVEALINRYDKWFFSNQSFKESIQKDPAIEIKPNWKPGALSTPLLINVLTTKSAPLEESIPNAEKQNKVELDETHS
ncbi:hypothetical protein IC229_30190 [Spirosoma sp. BT702]|uniref:Response receiver domain-containing protein n=1 Tax=Spirosoma profusum TaxID=2771354 RepID=A0A927AV21_9BACT|nr:hypothetical protein [Spirosoma profusum]MBD2704940.1 hypothetical protein [Spirosoma profusum]